MTRNFKALAMAFAAACAFAALSASTASATTQPVAHFRCSKYPCHINGSQIGKSELAVAGGSKTCEFVKLKSTPISKASTSLTVHPEYSGCELHNELLGTHTKATIFMNECYFTFTVHSKGTAGETPTVTESIDHGGGKVTDYWHGDTHIKCPGGKNIITRTFKDAGHTEIHCEFRISGATVDGIDYRVETVNGVAKHTSLVFTESLIPMERLKGGLLACGAEKQEAFYSGEMTVESLNESNEEVVGDISFVTT